MIEGSLKKPDRVCSMLSTAGVMKVKVMLGGRMKNLKLQQKLYSYNYRQNMYTYNIYR